MHNTLKIVTTNPRKFIDKLNWAHFCGYKIKSMHYYCSWWRLFRTTYYACAEKIPKISLKFDIGPVTTRAMSPVLVCSGQAARTHKPPRKGISAMASLLLTAVQKVSLSISPVDAAGNSAPVEDVSWSSSDESILTVTPSEDGLSCVAETTGKLGVAQVVVKADARIGEDVNDLTGALDIEVVAAEAVSLGIAAGVPESRI
jgi:hypothetical protein